MSIQRCKHCSEKLSRKSILRSIWIGAYSPIKCDRCKSNNYPTITTRLLMTFCLCGPMLIGTIISMHYPKLSILLIKFYFSSFKTNLISGYFIMWLLIYFLWIAFIVWLTPFIARFNLKKKSYNKY
jgi:CXXC-20-CXXC protein